MRRPDRSPIQSNVLMMEQAPREPSAVYRHFYNLYGSPGFATEQGRVRSLVLDGRVLHQNTPHGADRSRHLIVGQLESARWISNHVSMPSRPNLRGRPQPGDSDFRPQHNIVYSRYSFFVAACDGNSISTYAVRTARSIYDHPIDIRNPRDDNKFEQLTLEIDDEHAGSLALTFQRGTGNGLLRPRFAKPGQRTEPFWILSADESQLERAFATSGRRARNRDVAPSLAQMVFAA